MPFFCFPTKKKKTLSSREIDEKRYLAYRRLCEKYTKCRGEIFNTRPGGPRATECCESILLDRSVSFGDWGKTLREVFTYQYKVIEEYERRRLGTGVSKSCILEYMYSDVPALRRESFAQLLLRTNRDISDKEAKEREKKKNELLAKKEGYECSAIAYIWAAGSLSQNDPYGNFSSRRTINKLKELNPKSEMRVDYFSDDKVYLKYAIEEYDNKPTSYMFEELERYVTTNRSQTSILYRGMPSRYIPSVGEIYQPQRFFAASRSINTATRFAPDSGGIIIEIIGRAAYIPNVYYNGDESEYLFSRNARFRVTKGQNGNIKLIQI